MPRVIAVRHALPSDRRTVLVLADSIEVIEEVRAVFPASYYVLAARPTDVVAIARSIRIDVVLVIGEHPGIDAAVAAADLPPDRIAYAPVVGLAARAALRVLAAK